MFSNFLLLEANECCGTCDILLKKCILHCLDGPKFHRFDTFCGVSYGSSLFAKVLLYGHTVYMYYMGVAARKPVNRASDKARFKPASSAAETS